jgi:hypothetical protein
MEELIILTRTSPACGGATSTSSKDNGSLAAYATAAAYSFTNHQSSITMLQDGQSGSLQFYQLEIRELERERDRERESELNLVPLHLITWPTVDVPSDVAVCCSSLVEMPLIVIWKFFAVETEAASCPKAGN